MRRAVMTLILAIFVLAPQAVYSATCLSVEEYEYLQEMKRQGILPSNFRVEELTQEECKMMKVVISEEQEDKCRKNLTNHELEALDALLRSKWNEMVQALAQKNIDKAASCFSDSSRERYRQAFLRIPPERYPKMVQDLANARIKFVREMGDSVEYDLRTVRDGREYSYFLLFAKDWNGEWKIMSY